VTTAPGWAPPSDEFGPESLPKQIQFFDMLEARPSWNAGGPPAFSIRKHRKGSWLGIDLSVAFHAHSTQPAAKIPARTTSVGCVLSLAKRNRWPSTSSTQRHRPGLSLRFIYEGSLKHVADSHFLAYSSCGVCHGIRYTVLTSCCEHARSD